MVQSVARVGEKEMRRGQMTRGLVVSGNLDMVVLFTEMEMLDGQ